MNDQSGVEETDGCDGGHGVSGAASTLPTGTALSEEQKAESARYSALFGGKPKKAPAGGGVESEVREEGVLCARWRCLFCLEVDVLFCSGVGGC